MEPSMNEAYKQLVVDHRKLQEAYNKLQVAYAALLKKTARSKRKR